MHLATYIVWLVTMNMLACGVMLMWHHYGNFKINALSGDTHHLVISQPIVSIDWRCHAMLLAYHSTTKHR